MQDAFCWYKINICMQCIEVVKIKIKEKYNDTSPNHAYCNTVCVVSFRAVRFL